MNGMKRLWIGTFLALGLMLAGSALAGHTHRIQTPGTCVEGVARGQTSITALHPGGFHRFHDNVHKGQGAVNGVMEGSGNVQIFVGPCPL